MTILLLLAVLQQPVPPEIKIDAKVTGGTFTVSGTTDLPDKARLTIYVERPREATPVRLAVLNVEVKERRRSVL